MSKIGNWVLELQERKVEVEHPNHIGDWILEVIEEREVAVRQLNPYNKYSNEETTAGQYYVDYTGYRNEHQARQDLVRSH